MSVLRAITSKVVPVFQKKTALTVRDLIKMESKVGSQIFGPVPKDHRREFFCLDEHTWVWYEAKPDPETGQLKSITTRYEIRGERIIKMQDGQPYRYTSLDETKNLLEAVKRYYSLVSTQVYGQVSN